MTVQGTIWEEATQTKPVREYDYIDEKNKKRKHTPRQHKLREFFDIHNVDGLTRRKQQELYEEWLNEKGWGNYEKYCYGVLSLEEESNYNDTGIARAFRKDLYALKYSETMHKVITKNGIPETTKEAVDYAKGNLIKRLHELKLAWQIIRKVEKDHQTRITFSEYEKTEIRAVKEME